MAVERSSEIILKGIPVSEGITYGKISLYRSELEAGNTYSINPEQVSDELEKYFSALHEVSLQFMEKQNRIARDLGTEQAEIYDAYRLILEDPFFQQEIPAALKKELTNSESVILDKLRQFEQKFAEITDEYLKERIYDIRGVSRRIIQQLSQVDTHFEIFENQNTILIAKEITPVDTVYFQHKFLKGIVTEFGGKTSHAAILAHSLEIAALVGVENLTRYVKKNSWAIIDSYRGILVVNPSDKTKNTYQKKLGDLEKRKKRLKKIIPKPLPIITDTQIKLMATINDENEIELANKYLADGVGLYRTELQFISKGRFLNEDEQYQLYKKLLSSFSEQEVIIRLLDMGGDKFLPLAKEHEDPNPFLGWRSIRILLSEKDILRTQLRALFRSSKFGKLKIMIPMVSSLEDVLSIKSVMTEVAKDFDDSVKNIPVGIMVEIPSVAIEIDKILPQVDFASIGTNDLVQYLLAVDRNNEKVADYYQPLNSAVLKLIEKVAASGKKLNKQISICGEIAGETLYTPLLLALGIYNLSVHPALLPKIKNVLLNLSDDIINQVRTSYGNFELSGDLSEYLKSIQKTIKE